MYLRKPMHKKMNFSVKNLFSKCEHIRIKLRIYSHLLNKSLTENFIFCVVNIIGFTTESCKFFFKTNCQSLVYFTSINSLLFTSILLALAVNKSTFTLAGAYDFSNFNMICCLTGYFYSIQFDHCWILCFNKIACLYHFPPLVLLL